MADGSIKRRNKAQMIDPMNPTRKPASILVVGGAGYIGSHMVKALSRAGHKVTTLDNLSSGHRDAVLAGEFIEGDLCDKNLLVQVLSQGFDGVMHFASSIQVGESVRRPDLYYQNNVANTINLLNAMVEHGIKRLIFSSTAAIFGMPSYTPIDEKHPKQPINPYGRTKLIVEEVLHDYERAFELRSVCLRYFNAAGADPERELGERHDPETHLIPLVLQVASGRKDSIQIFGDDYATADGTCVRDYIHVSDLCDAHLLALDHLLQGGASQRYNLGNGQGYSVKEIVNMAERVTGQSIKVAISDRRAGDPAALVADATASRETLGWSPKYASLERIIADAWAWETRVIQKS